MTVIADLHWTSIEALAPLLAAYTPVVAPGAGEVGLLIGGADGGGGGGGGGWAPVVPAVAGLAPSLRFLRPTVPKPRRRMNSFLLFFSSLSIRLSQSCCRWRTRTTLSVSLDGVNVFITWMPFMLGSLSLSWTYSHGEPGAAFEQSSPAHLSTEVV